VATLEKQAETTATKVQVNAELEAMRLEMSRMKDMFKQMMSERDADRKDFDTTARYAIATEELEMAKNTPPEQKSAIISPNS